MIGYIETKNTIREDYHNHIKYSSFTPGQVAYFELDEYKRTIANSPMQKITIFIALAVVGLEFGELIPEVMNEIIKIIDSKSLELNKSEFDKEAFDLLNSDLSIVKSKILKF